MKQTAKRKRRQDAAHAKNLPKRRALIKDRYCVRCQFKYRCHDEEDGRRRFRCPPYQALEEYSGAVGLIEALADLDSVGTYGWRTADLNTKPRVSGRTAYESQPPKYDDVVARFAADKHAEVAKLTRKIRNFLGKRQIELFGCYPGSECMSCGWRRDSQCQLGRLENEQV